ncbi:p53 and DNA damage-regulated protein 1 isoform X2 [Etheostoma spectabile]|uniref:p53 and DNA damage-regulated protein 1 isoform X2 n=1 Tax=Etheostoma spectabile TaxID=54343 RepID=UPI0013AF2927|nr:p53 and DNA damage-regulated protein 1 isoform X2 [Etheostoma spectabile]
MDAVSQRVLENLTEVEEAAEDVLTSKQQIVDLDTRRNRNREALNALKNEISDSDQEQLDQEINELRKGLKAKVNLLNEMQGKPELRGYNLSPLSNDEIKAINSLL